MSPPSFLIVVGMTMNIFGVVLGSFRDLSSEARALGRFLTRPGRPQVARVRDFWRRLRGKAPESHAASVSGGASVSVGASGTAFVWYDIPDDLETPQVLDRLKRRTDSLQQMVRHEAAARVEAVDALQARIDALQARIADAQQQSERGLSSIRERIDDIDVKPAGQRAFGALLVILGTALMAIGGLLA